MRGWLFVGSLLMIVGCSSSHSTGGDGGADAASSSDAGAATDAATDAGEDVDAGEGVDAGDTIDAGCGLTEPLYHRAVASTCDADRPSFPDPVDPIEGSECASHAECTAGANGRCVAQRFGYGCTYDGCFEDAECGGGGPCLCRGDATGGSVHRCTIGNCTKDDDCGPGGYCSPTFGSCGTYSGTIGFYCHTCADECTDDSDCGGSGGFSPYCAFDPAVAHWTCQDTHCAG